MDWKTYWSDSDVVMDGVFDVAIYHKSLDVDAMPQVHTVVRTGVVIKQVVMMDHTDLVVPYMVGWDIEELMSWINDWGIDVEHKTLRLYREA